MLILSRRVGESIMIGDDVRVTILGIKGGQIRVGVDAPKSISVHRQEVYERLRRENTVSIAVLKAVESAGENVGENAVLSAVSIAVLNAVESAVEATGKST